MSNEAVARVHLPHPGPVASPLPPSPEGRPRTFHRTMEGYAPSRALALRALATSLGVGEVWVKDESARLGLPSFKILGGAWAVHRLLMRRADADYAATTFADLREVAAKLRPLTLTTATDGNHGRGVARMARLLGLDAVIVVPSDMVQARIAAIESEGATVIICPGDYDDAVAMSAAEGSEQGWEVIADVAYDGYTEVPTWVMDGYDTIFDECDEQLSTVPTVVFVQAGVGALAGATIKHYAPSMDTRFAVVEPLQAACLLESALKGSRVALASSQGSIMAGLNCGTPSSVAWPTVDAATDAYIAISDDRAREAMLVLATEGIEAGESGAAGLAGLLEIASSDKVRDALRLDERAVVLLLNTEGATDPVAYHRLLSTID